MCVCVRERGRKGGKRSANENFYTNMLPYVFKFLFYLFSCYTFICKTFSGKFHYIICYIINSMVYLGLNLSIDKLKCVVLFQ